MSGRSLQLRSYAKINLGLEVLGLREDGYHELRTLFQSIDLHDDLTLRLTRTGRIRVSCDHPCVPCDETNLAWRAARDVLTWAKRAEGVEISIVKRIPVAGGLGGGSSNAAAVLLALDRALRLGLGPRDSTPSPGAWAPTCPTSCGAEPRWASPGATRSTPWRGRCARAWSWSIRSARFRRRPCSDASTLD